MTAAPLASRVPAQPDAGAILDAFAGWVAETGLSLYPAQEEAVLELLDGAHVVLNTPTGSGKSLVAVAAHFDALCRRERSFYTSPIKALVSEKFFALCDTFGAENVGMMTGDAAINRTAPIICCTAEVLANLALREGEDARADLIIHDEFHYYGDRDRGTAWQVPLLALPRARFLLMSATLGDTEPVERALIDRTGRRVAVVRSAQRPVPLVYDWAQTALLETIQAAVERDRAPVYVVNFTQADAAELAQSLTSTNLCSSDEKKRIDAAIGHFRFDSPYGRKISRYVRHGVGLHHAGLLPKYRLLVERLAQQGLLKVICGTDTLGVGVNVPIRTVLFTKLYKFDGEKRRLLGVREFQQIAGRAGRKGFDSIGYVVCQEPEHIIENRRREAKASSGGKKAKFEKAQPEKGYVPYDAETFEKLAKGSPEPLQSVFRIDHAMMLHLLKRPHEAGDRGGYAALVRLIGLAHQPPASQRRLRRAARRLFVALRDAGLVELVRRDDGPGSRVRLAAELGDDFSVFQTLALYLLEVLPVIDLDAPDHAAQILTLCEAILESPTPVLYAQQRRAKGERIAELKAEGMDYEDRMAELEKVTWPKPMAELIWETFDAFAAHHPWVGSAHADPKSVARDMYERWLTFNDYVAELDLERVEGVLLRYLSQVYRTVVQTVPAAYRSDEVVDLIGYLRTMLERVDSSLLQEWEKLLEPAPGDDVDLQAPRYVDIAADARSFRARVRAEMHLLVRALSREDYAEVAEATRGVEWTAERIAASMADFVARRGPPVFDHRARLADRTLLRSVGDRVWEVTQRLTELEDDDDFAIVGVIELPRGATIEGPLIELRAIGPT